jgi:hypothetical protein
VPVEDGLEKGTGLSGQIKVTGGVSDDACAFEFA